MAIENKATGNQSGINLQALGLNSPMEVIDLLGMLKIDGDPVIKDDKAFLDPKVKVQEVMDYFSKNFGVTAQELPYVASTVKQELKKGFKV